MAGSENINVTCYLYVKVQIETKLKKQKQKQTKKSIKNKLNKNFHTAQVDFVGLFEKQNQHLFKNSFSTTTTTTTKASGTFPFTCPVTALPVSYRRRLTLCTALSTSPPRFTSRDLVSLLAIELNNLILVRRR